MSNLLLPLSVFISSFHYFNFFLLISSIFVKLLYKLKPGYTYMELARAPQVTTDFLTDSTISTRGFITHFEIIFSFIKFWKKKELNLNALQKKCIIQSEIH